MTDRTASDLLLRVVVLVSLCVLIPLATGCVRRKVAITSTPSEALVWVNSQEVGRTPLVFEFTYDGTYDVRLIHDDCVALSTSASTDPPVWDLPGIDFFAEIMPIEFTREVAWHFDLEAATLDPRKRLVAARAMRAKIEAPEPDWISTSVESESASSEVDPIDPIGSPSLPPDTPAEVPEVDPPQLYPPGEGPQAGD